MLDDTAATSIDGSHRGGLGAGALLDENSLQIQPNGDVANQEDELDEDEIQLLNVMSRIDSDRLPNLRDESEQEHELDIQDSQN